jgi:glycine/D-amino acid oxidase-like deaminating enzyme
MSASLQGSLWTATVPPSDSYPALAGRRSVEVAIVGAGYMGLSAALHLAEAGVETVVLDSHEPGWGASGRNGGQVLPGLRHDPEALLALLGSDLGAAAIRTAATAPDVVFDLIARHEISCDAVRAGWIQAAQSGSALDGLRRRDAEWRALGADVAMLDARETALAIGGGGYVGGWLDRRGGTVHPLKFARGLAHAATGAGAAIHGASRVTALARDGDGWRVTTAGGTILAERAILTGNAYVDDLWPDIRRSIMPIWSFQIATDPLPPDVAAAILPQGHAVADTRPLMLYFRKDADGRLIIGGRGPFDDDPSDWTTARVAAALARWLARLFPQLGPVRPAFAWTGRVAWTEDRLPHLHDLGPGLLAGLGCNGRGVAMATARARPRG